MTPLIRFIAVMSASLVLSGYSLATPVLSLVPSVEKIHPPESFYIDVVVSGLQSKGTDTLLGAFDLTVSYNPLLSSLLTTGGSSYGSGLGDPGDPLQTFVGADTSTVGQFRFFEVSLLENSASTCTFCLGPYLQDLQSDTFTLASLQFYAPGTSAAPTFTNFFLSDALLSDGSGNAVAGVAIQNATLAIEEPQGLLLLGTALGAAALFGRRRRMHPEASACLG